VDAKKTQEAYNILCLLNRQQSEVVTLFKSDWESIFSSTAVPPVQVFRGEDSIVRVNRVKAMEYLKNTYNFYTKEERKKALEEIAREIEELS
jgi:hypothetical protein